jgi:hypothetical protein
VEGVDEVGGVTLNCVMKKFVTIVCLFCWSYSYGQLYDAQWALGYDESVLDFRAADTIGVYSIPTLEYFTVTNASICDEEGNLLYYTNGISICGVDSILENGSGLNPCPYTGYYTVDGLNINQAALFIPQPGSSRYYYLFHFSNDAPDSLRPSTIYYSLIDKQGNNGQGSVIKKNMPILNSAELREGGMTACKHANGRDYWLVMGGSNNNTFYKFLITPDSIIGPYLQNIGPIFPIGYDVATGEFSEDGSKYATCIFAGAPILVMDFDRCSGEFSNPVILNEVAGFFPNQDTIFGCYSLEFSPSSQFLYVSNPSNLVQYDLWATNIQDSSQLFLGDSTDYFGIDMLQTAENGKLYGSTWNGGLKALHVVNHPDLKGDSAGFVYGGQPTLTQNALSLPNLINYKLGSLVGSGCDTIPTGVAQQTISNSLRVLPNPADKYAYVEMGAQGNYEFDLLTVSGQVMATKQTQQVDIFDTETLAPGVYFLRVTDKTTGAQLAAKKVVVVH